MTHPFENANGYESEVLHFTNLDGSPLFTEGDSVVMTRLNDRELRLLFKFQALSAHKIITVVRRNNNSFSLAVTDYAASVRYWPADGRVYGTVRIGGGTSGASQSGGWGGTGD